MTENLPDTSIDYDDRSDRSDHAPEVEQISTLTDFFGLSEEEKLQEEWTNPYRQWHAGGMPAYASTDLAPYKQIIVSLRNEEDYHAFAKLLNQVFTPKTRGFFWPEKSREENITNKWVEDE